MGQMTGGLNNCPVVIIFYMGWPTVPYLSSHDLDRASDETSNGMNDGTNAGMKYNRIII